MHMYHITFTIKHGMPHFIYIYTHVLHNIDLVMLCVLFILNVSFYPTYTIQECILKALGTCIKSVEFRMYLLGIWTYDYSGILTRKVVIATVTSTCQSSQQE